MADQPSAPLSGALLARKGAASADGFALADRERTRSSARWRMAVFSATLAISVGVIAFVGAALMFGGEWASSVAPGRTARVSAAFSPAATEPAAGLASPASPPRAAAPSNMTPLAVAVANDLGKPPADKIMASTPPQAPSAVPRASEPTPPPKQSVGVEARPTASLPPSPKRRPRDVARAGYRVQLHALVSDAAVRREWRRLRKRHGALLSGLKLTVSPIRTDAGDTAVYRLQLGALSSRTQARSLCRKLRRKKLSCMVVR